MKNCIYPKTSERFALFSFLLEYYYGKMASNNSLFIYVNTHKKTNKNLFSHNTGKYNIKNITFTFKQ